MSQPLAGRWPRTNGPAPHQLVAVVLGALLVAGGATIAQEPDAFEGLPPVQLEPHQIPQLSELPPLPPSQAARIRDELDGRGSDKSSGNPLLDGVFEVIRQRGSVLDGSSLDARHDELSCRPDSLDLRNRLVPAAMELPTSRSNDSRKFRMAEMLLRSARKLEALQAGEKSRSELVAKMRAEAVQLLSQ